MKQLVDYWRQVATVFDRCLPAKPPLDLVIIEFEPEGGLIKAYFNDSKNQRRSSPVVLNGVVSIMAEAYECCHRRMSRTRPSKRSTRASRRCERETECAIVDSLREPEAAALMSQLVSKHGLTMKLRWEGSEEDKDLEGLVKASG